ncbi:myogenesis-regulating glycosidase-like [Ptychodera flava]|uniref:myogenesis-regulating glycosidase-like n=1 Tax=Ptychodera flava TaxID=63121 RepID=UPI00396A4915
MEMQSQKYKSTEVMGDVKDDSSCRSTRACWAIVTGIIILLLTVAIVVLLVYLLPKDDSVTFSVGDASLMVNGDTNQVSLNISSKRGVVLSGDLGGNLPASPEHSTCDGHGDGSACIQWEDVAKLEMKSEVFGENTCYDIKWTALDKDHTLLDCFWLKGAHWYGSAEMYYQLWPIEQWDEPMTLYLSGDMFARPTDYGSVLERYWLSSQGVGIFVDGDVPLFASLNSDNDNKVCYQATYENSPYPNPDGKAPFMHYTVCTGSNVKTIHRYMASRFFEKPVGIPDERMIRLPIWSTWARYKINISESVVMDYAREINDNNFPNSQLEIDDGWATKYGDLTFDPIKFPNPRNMCDELHDLGFRVTIWTTPFGNYDSEAFREGLVASDEGNHYWVREPRNQAPGLIRWWNGIAGILDVTHEEAYQWNVQRLKDFTRDTGVDSYKFDAGEINYLPVGFIANEEIVNPGEYTKLHADMSAELGGMIEIRAAWQSQDLPVFVRMMDKDSKWGYDNGFKTLINTALTFGILGYPFVLPDMIGGNAYNEGFHNEYLPEKELFLRWLELTAFLPSMQFSVSPWQYEDEEVTNITRYWVNFHDETIGPKLVELAREATVTGDPIIRPLWWIAPEDETALTIDSEFLVGDDLLVAPILDEGETSRDVYLPAGDWVDEMSGETVTGGKWIEMSVPIDKIAYFTKA